MNRSTPAKPGPQPRQLSAGTQRDPPPGPSLAELRGAALACLLAISSSDQPAKLAWLQEAGGYGRDATSSGLNTLAQFGMVRYDHGWRAWLLTAVGKHFILRRGWQAGGTPPASENQGSAVEINDPAQIQGHPPRNHLPPENQVAAPEASSLRLENQGLEPGLPLKEVKEEYLFKDLRDFKESKESKESININSSRLSSTPEGSQNQLPDQARASDEVNLARVLEACGALFGEPLLGQPAHYQDSRRLLAIIAETSHNRDRLRKPARVVFSAYKQGRIPAAVYLDNPLRFLPDEFLQRTGLRQRVSARGWTSTVEDELDDGDEILPPTKSPPSPYKLRSYFPSPPPDCCAPGIDPEIARRWYLALLQIKDYIGPFEFSDYVVDLILVKCDLETGDCQIGCCDAAQLAWLETFLLIRLQRLLSAIWARELQVKFILWPGCEDV